ncbi:hypothetical protein NE237_018723 [Protea cynaroides]|uniref:Uncharacterized protein n=1 Tax=Protea cynaroides TaxID=273540 RepID=A0A9Q0KAH4_9MAGN|nr:hypothetical protein NE237_018723 [Protea cynaroides]
MSSRVIVFDKQNPNELSRQKSIPPYRLLLNTQHGRTFILHFLKCNRSRNSISKLYASFGSTSGRELLSYPAIFHYSKTKELRMSSSFDSYDSSESNWNSSKNCFTRVGHDGISKELHG